MSVQVSSESPVKGAPPVLGTPGTSTLIRPITYDEVFRQVEENLSAQLEAKGRSMKRLGNFRTARNGWMMSCGASEDEPVGIEFGSQFSDFLDKHLVSLAAEGKAAQTLADRRSILRVYREAWVEMLQAATVGLLEGDFAQTLCHLIESSGIPIRTICDDAEVHWKSLYSWRKARSVPTKRFLPAVHRLENIFGLPCGTLTAKLPSVLLGECSRIKGGLTGYRQHLSGMRQLRYYLHNFPSNLQAEWNRLVLFYTDTAWLKTQGLLRNSKWRVREHDNRCPTAEIMHSSVGGYLGYLSLEVNESAPNEGGRGFRLDQMTLALLSDSELVYSFLQFKRERTYLKRYNTNTTTFLRFCLTLLRPKTGYLWQSPQFGSKLPKPVPEDEWHTWCESQRSIIKETFKELIREDEIKKTRDPFEPIRAIIINNQHPLDVLFELALTYESESPPSAASPRAKANHFQNLFLMKFATILPLRSFNLSVLTWRKDNTGNLYQKPDGAWWVRIDPSYLKNHKRAAKGKPFDVPLHESLWPYIEKFLFDHRPNLLGANRCDYVFRPGKARQSKRAMSPYKEVPKGYLSAQIFRITQRYIPDCPGFGLHAFRHLVATEYIKNNPAGYAVAGAVLHDKEETVKKNYDWVLPADKFFFWNEYVGELLKKLKQESPAEKEEVTR